MIRLARVMVLIFLLASQASASNLDLAWRKVIFVESSNGQNKKAYTPNSCGACGIAQIRPIMVKDINRILRVKAFVHSDTLDDAASKEMFRVYQEHYNKGASVEKMCRSWYAGPGKRLQASKQTDEYWKMCLNSK